MKYLVEINGKFYEVEEAAGTTIVVHWAGVDIPIVVGGYDIRLDQERQGIIPLVEAKLRARYEANPWRRHFMLLSEQAENCLSLLESIPDDAKNDGWQRIAISYAESHRYGQNMLAKAEKDGEELFEGAIAGGALEVFYTRSGRGGDEHQRFSLAGIPGSIGPFVVVDGETLQLFLDSQSFETWLDGVKRAAAKAEETTGDTRGTAHAKAWLQSAKTRDGKPLLPAKRSELVSISGFLRHYKAWLKQQGGGAAGHIPTDQALAQRLRRAVAELGFKTRKNKPGAGRKPKINNGLSPLKLQR